MSEDKKNGKQNKTVKPFDPMTLRGVTVRNRIWLPPMDTYSALAQDGKPTPFHYQHYVSRAMGGFGMIIMEATAVAPGGRISPCDLGLWDDGQMDAWRWIVADAKAVEAAGACMGVMEGVPAKLAARISEELTIPTIGIGAGAGCDGQVLVYQDLLAMYGDFRPKFVKVFANVGEVMREGVKAYIKETKEGTFPGEEHCFKIDDSVIEKLY